MNVGTDPIADFLTRIRNASRALKEEVNAPYSGVKANIARILKDEGYIWNYELDNSGEHPEIKVKVKYVESTPAISGIKRVSRPGLRQYVGVKEIPRVLGGLGISIVSTSRGVLSGGEARRQKVGGELLAIVW